MLEVNPLGKRRRVTRRKGGKEGRVERKLDISKPRPIKNEEEKSRGRRMKGKGLREPEDEGRREFEAVAEDLPPTASVPRPLAAAQPPKDGHLP